PLLDKVVYTSSVTQQHLDDADQLRASPSIFQSRVEKAYELRVTVVGRQLFATKIFSQSDTSTALDWRKKPVLNDFQVEMQETELPKDVESKIWSFMQKIGLTFGCIDLAVTPSGDYVFFEINPNGQWYFVQLRTGQKIAKAIAHALLGN